MEEYVMALDQGTTSSRCLLFDRLGQAYALSQLEIRQDYPKPGWVEQDPMEIWSTQMQAARKSLKEMGDPQINAIGITNQRETVIVWDRHTGRPVHPAISWQCRRTAEVCEKLKQRGLTPFIRERTGLLLDSYFSATKLKWILDTVPGARERAAAGDFLFGTVDSWLIWKLTEGRVHATDYSNAARTMLFDIRHLKWDKELLALFDIPEKMLPQVRPSSGAFGVTNLFGRPIPIQGAAGDQQASLFGQNCFEKGSIKCTYGTGCFLLMNTGAGPVFSQDGLLTTVAWGVGNKVEYALEGSVFTGGAAIQWLRDEMGLLHTAAESEEAARGVEDMAGVYLVPAFTGLGAPYWDPYARGILTGLTRGITKNHIIRAGLESIAYQVQEVTALMERDSGIPFAQLKVDGGASANNFLMQFQSDLLQKQTLRPACVETTALGAACLAGLSSGFWGTLREIQENTVLDRIFFPAMEEKERKKKLAGWQAAVARARHH